MPSFFKGKLSLEKIYISIPYFSKVQNHSSKYTGVTWNQQSKKWKAQVTHDYKPYHGGYFDNEEQAAMKVNLLCDTLDIERKNPKIKIEMDEIQQVTHILFIVHEKIK